MESTTTYWTAADQAPATREDAEKVWVDETHRILFDVGDGATALLEGKIHKARVIALTHAHRDHIAGLPQLLNLRGRRGPTVTP